MNVSEGLNIPTQANEQHVLVISQSLVAKTYRSFYSHLAAQPSVMVTLVSPQKFRELGFQIIESPPFDPPFDNTSGHHHAFRLPVFSPHVQIVIFWGLTRVLLNWLKMTRRSSNRPVVLCLAEPYSVTGFCAFLSLSFASLLTATRPLFMLHGLQNIFKTFPQPLRIIQSFLFRVNPFMLATGVEQKDVLRRHGYAGTIIDFPLWFDSSAYQSVRSLSRLEARKQLSTTTTVSASSEETFIIGFAGSFLAEKGIDVLLAAFREVAQAHKQKTALWLCGKGPESERLIREFEKLKSEGFDVTYFGALPSKVMPTFYRSLDVLAVPSLTADHWKEQFGRIIIEARAVGTPVIGSDSGEIPHVIGTPELIFEEGNAQAIARVLRHVQNSCSTSADYTESVCAANRQFSDLNLAKSFAHQLWALNSNHSESAVN